MTERLPARVPINIETIIGSSASRMIEEDFRMIGFTQPEPKRHWLSRVPGFRSLAVEPPANAFTEQTYRGTTYQSPDMGAFIGEFKPFDHLTYEIIDQMKRNGVIKTGLFLKKAPILAVVNKATIVHPVPRIQAYLNHVMEDILYPLAASSLMALDYGVSLHEKVFKAEKISFKYDQNGTTRTFTGNSIHYKKIKWNNPKTIKKIRIQPRSQDFDGYVQQHGMTEITIPIGKSFMYGKGQENTLWGTSDLDSVYEYWYWLELISGYYMRYLEKLGTPPMIGYAPNGLTYSKSEGKPVENLSWLGQLASSLQNGVAVVMPSVFDPNSRNRLWELREMALSDRGDLYDHAITWLEGAIFKGLFVPDKPVASGNTSIGSYALADVQFEAFLTSEEWDLKNFIFNVEKYVLRPLIDLNFGETVEDAKINYPPMSREIKQRVFDIFKDLVDGHPDFTAVNFQEMATELGLPLYSEEEIKAKREESFEDAQRMAEINTPPEKESSSSDKSDSKAASVVIQNPAPEMTFIQEDTPRPKRVIIRKEVVRDDFGAIIGVNEEHQEEES